MEQLVERIAKASLGIKVVVVVAALLVITLLNYFVIGVPPPHSINEIEARIVRSEAELKKANAQFIEKQAIANDLNRFRRERELLEQRFNEAKAELPDQVQIDDLLAAFQDRAQKAGLEIVSIEPKKMVVGGQGFYASVPIAVAVTGNYHEIAAFLDALGRLRRIVNVSDITLDAPRDVNGRLLLAARFTATTFTFVDQATAAGASGKGKKTP
jgi:type IV pilus assembly protein PilO